MARTLEDLRKERENQKTQTRTLESLRFERNSSDIINDISNKIKAYDNEVKKYGDIYNSTFFDSNGKAKTGYIGNVGEQGKAATIQAANIVAKRNAVQNAVNEWSDYLDNDYKASINKYFEDSNTALTKLSKDFQNSYDYYSKFKDEADFNQKDVATLEGARTKIAALEAEKAEIDEWLKNPQYLPLSDSELKQETTPEARESAIQRHNQIMRNSFKFAKEDIEEQIFALQKVHFPGEVRTWFDAGAFEDGWQRGDLGKTINATAYDLEANILGGGLDMIEGIVDTGAYALGGIGRLMGSHWFQDRMTDFIQKDLYNYLGEDIHSGADIINALNSVTLEELEASLLGDKTDSLIQSGGQLAATVATTLLSKGLIPWWVTTGASSFGGQAETALNEGASYGQAGVSALISAGAEILSEKLSGGISFGGGTLDDVVLDPLLDKISNKVVKALAKTGIDAAGEGFEEIFSGVVSNLGTALYKEESLDEILLSEEALDEYVEGFIGGAVLGGAMGGVRNTGEAIDDAKNTMQTGNRIQQTPSAVDELVELGRSLPQTANLADKVLTNPTAYKTGRLYERVGQAVTPENEEGTRKYTRLNNQLFPVAEQSPAVSAEAADRINTAFTKAIDKTELPEEAKSVIAQKFVLPANIDPNSYEAEKYARDFADDAALAYEAGEIQQKTGEKLPDGWLQQNVHVATPEQVDYYTKLGRERVLAEQVENAQNGELKQKNNFNESNIKYSLNSYSQHQIDNWSNNKNIIIYENDNQLRQFIDGARKGENLSQKIYFGAIPKSLALRIKKDTGVEVENFNCTLRASEIRKIISDHGNERTESLRGQRAVVEDDFIAIPQIIQSPDEIRLSDKQFEGKPVIEFVKTINGRTTVVSYVSKKHLDLTVQTMYSGIKKGNLATAAGDQAPANTPEAHVGTVPNNSIFEKSGNVNRKYSTPIGQYTADTTERVQARKKLLARSADEVRTATRNDTTLTAEQREAAEFGEKIGVAVGFVDTTQYYRTKRDGISLKSKGIIILDKMTENPLKQVFIHELAHFSETSKTYAKLSKKIMESKALDNWLTEKGYTGSFANKKSAYRAEKKRAYSENGVALTKDGADAEMIANFLAETIGTEEKFNAFMSELTKEQKKNFLDYIKEVIDWFKATFTNSVPAEIRQIEKLYKKAIKEAVEGVKERKQTNKNTKNDAEFSIYYPTYTRKELDNNAIILRDMLPVKELSGEEFKKDGDVRLRDKVLVFFNELGNSVYTKEFGDVGLTLSSVRSDLSHGLTYGKITSFAAIPEVITDGVVIDFQKRGNGNYDRIVVAAPIKINNDLYYMGVMLQRDYKTQRLYLHDVVSEKEAILLNSEHLSSNRGAKEFDNLYMTTILQKALTVKSEEQFSVPTEAIAERKERTYGTSIPERTRKLRQEYADGKIGFDELVAGETQLMEEAREKYGTIEEGENPQERVKVPQGVEKNKNVSRYVRTILETGVVSEALAAEIGEKTLLGDFSHKVLTDKKALEDADKAIKNGTAKEKWYTAVGAIHSMPTKNQIAVGEKLLEKAMKDGKTTEALEIASDLVDVYTRAGQLVQSARLLKQMTGTGRLIHLQRTVNRINEDIEKKNEKIKNENKKHPLIKIGENLAEELVKATTPEDVEAIAKEIEQDVAGQMKVTWLDKWNAWRYLSMLGNPLTHARNVVGNGIFVPVVSLQKAIGAGLESFIPAEQRTRALKVDKAYREFAENDAKSKAVQDILDGTDKMTGEAKAMRDRRIFKSKILHFLSTFNKNALSAEDAVFKNYYYKTALASFLQARNVDLSNVSEEQLSEARVFAINEALKSTYNDLSKTALFIKKLEKSGKLANIVVNGFVPFKQTPINIIKRGVEYSPIGLSYALTVGVYKLSQGQITAAQFIDSVSAGSSGTIAFAVGALLSSLGWVTGGFGDDDEDRFKKLTGEQEYSLQVFGKSYTLDWAAPISIPFFIGVELINSMRKKNYKATLQDISDVFWNSLDPIVNLSMLSGIENTISSMRYADKAEMIGAAFESVFSSYFGQAVPTIGGKIAGITDDLRRSNYIDKNSQVPAFLQRMYNSAIAKIPGVSDSRKPYIDAWGRTVSQGGVVERFLENFISPGYFSDVDYTDVDMKLLELFEATGETSMFPDSAPKYIIVDKARKELTSDEYMKYAAAKGQYSFAYLKEFFDSDYAKELTPEEQIKAIEKIYKYANEKAKAVVSSYDVEKNNKTAYKEEEDGRSVVDYFSNKVKAERYAPSLYNQALDDGDMEEADRLKAEIIEWKMENGKTERDADSELKSAVTSYWKPLYIEAYIEDDTAEVQRIRKLLEDTGYYPNLNSTIREWYNDYKAKQREKELEEAKKN